MIEFYYQYKYMSSSLTLKYRPIHFSNKGVPEVFNCLTLFDVCCRAPVFYKRLCMHTLKINFIHNMGSLYQKIIVFQRLNY